MGFSQKKLAEKCGAAHSYIRQIESGNRSPSFAFLAKIAEALQIEPYQLFYSDASEPDGLANLIYIESLQKNLLEAVSKDIQEAFCELKKYQ